MVRTLAHALSLGFPNTVYTDLMPADVLGNSIVIKKAGDFTLRF